jgi:Family of unknown function (DUF6221)
MDDLITRLTAAIDAKEAKARAADTKTYGDDDEKVTARGSLTWIVYNDGDYTYVIDKACNNVALASDVDLSSETWEPMTLGRVEFIVDNDPDSVLRGCAADRKLIARGGPFCDCADAERPPMDPATNWTVPIPHHYDCAAYEAAKIMAERYGLEADGG